MSPRNRFVFVLSIVAVLALLSSLSVFALTGASISYAADPFDGGTCDSSWFWYDFAGTGSTDDAGGDDYFIVTMADANGVALDTDIYGIPVGDSFDTDNSADFFMINPITARPVTVALYDTGDASGMGENTQASYDFALTGTLLASFTVDPAIDIPSCASVPLLGAGSPGPNIPAGSVVGRLMFDTPAYYAPGNITSPVITLRAGATYWVIGVDASGAYYKIILANNYLWVPIEVMGPNPNPPQNGAPLPTHTVS